MNHELKCFPQYFCALKSGVKRFELRKNDRDFQVGDKLIIREYRRPENGVLTGRKLQRTIQYITKDAIHLGLMEGYCILGL